MAGAHTLVLRLLADWQREQLFLETRLFVGRPQAPCAARGDETERADAMRSAQPDTQTQASKASSKQDDDVVCELAGGRASWRKRRARVGEPLTATERRLAWGEVSEDQALLCCVFLWWGVGRNCVWSCVCARTSSTKAKMVSVRVCVLVVLRGRGGARCAARCAAA